MKLRDPDDWLKTTLERKAASGYKRWYAWYPVYISGYWYWFAYVYRERNYPTVVGTYRIPKYDYLTEGEYYRDSSIWRRE